MANNTAPTQEHCLIIDEIDPIAQLIKQAPNFVPSKLRVAAYARVSTEQDEQASSYEAQVDYYTRYITNHPNWELVGVFADRGVTGTNTKNREGFKRMIGLALNGEIDLILTKSISRFSRNTVDTLRAVRALREKGVEARPSSRKPIRWITSARR